jgi:hypothetical protein
MQKEAFAPHTSLEHCFCHACVLARIVELSHGANPFVLTAVSHGFECAVNDYVDGIYEAEERKYAIEVADIKLKVDTQRKALAASPSLRAVCATQIQEAVKRFLARRHHICGIELEISTAALAADTEPMIKVQIDGGANTNLFVSPLITARATKTGSITPLGLAGKGQLLPTQGDASLTIELFDEQAEKIAAGTINGVLAPTGRRDLLGVTPMCSTMRARTGLVTSISARSADAPHTLAVAACSLSAMISSSRSLLSSAHASWSRAPNCGYQAHLREDELLDQHR